MREEAAALRRRLAAIGVAKREAQAADIRAHLALPPGERLLQTLRHSDAHIRASEADHERVADDDAATWRRVRARLSGS